ncbi:hypothetical protein A1F99_085480 [Pyrenophora tritici-repentis]|nr:hypothetical protein A1F99_085480 [Pyrenophora tritici-repentis]
MLSKSQVLSAFVAFTAIAQAMNVPLDSRDTPGIA